jgi:hypothetical protein
MALSVNCTSKIYQRGCYMYPDVVPLEASTVQYSTLQWL